MIERKRDIENESRLKESQCKQTRRMDDLRKFASEIHPEVQSIERSKVEVPATLADYQTLPYYTKYEYTSIIGIRAQQIADGARPLVDLAESKITSSHPQFVWKVAEEELKKRVLPFIVHRRLPSGKSEFWSTKDLSILW